MKPAFIVVTLLLSFYLVSGQSSAFKDLKIDVTTPEDATKIFGKPFKDKTKKLSVTYPATTTTTAIQSEREIRELSFRKQKDFNELILDFYENRLFSIKLIPVKKGMPAADLSKILSRDFLFVEKLSGSIRLADFEGQKETSVPKIYPRFYTMLSVNSNTSVIVAINNDTWKAVWRDTLGKPTTEQFPGYAEQIMILSRSWEQK